MGRGTITRIYTSNGPRNGKQHHEKLGVCVFYGGAIYSGKLSVHYVHVLLLVDTSYQEGKASPACQAGSNPFHPLLHLFSDESRVDQGVQNPCWLRILDSPRAIT